MRNALTPDSIVSLTLQAVPEAEVTCRLMSDSTTEAIVPNRDVKFGPGVTTTTVSVVGVKDANDDGDRQPTYQLKYICQNMRVIINHDLSAH